MVESGLELFLKNPKKWISKNETIGIVVHNASIDSKYIHTSQLLNQHPHINLGAIFGPQHGVFGDKQDNMIESDNFHDPDLHLPVFSLYGDTRIPTEEMLSYIDTLIFDLQDVGTRIYTYVYTLALAMRACAKYKKRLIVLDRPNPINGTTIEGNLLDKKFESFVGMYEIPTRHGLTMGEFGKMILDLDHLDLNFEVIHMIHWKRDMWFDATRLPWMMPSPNMPTLDTATVFPGMVHFEGTNISEGRGTTRPFELVGAPFLDSKQFASYAHSLLPKSWKHDVVFQPCHFEPTFQKYTKQLCGGLHIHIRNRYTIDTTLIGIAILKAAVDLGESHFHWKQPPYEYNTTELPIDLIAGTSKLREFIETSSSIEEIRHWFDKDNLSFKEGRKKWLIYS